jgi:hypothetical protein
MTTNTRIRPFISYAREDLATAKQLLSDLRFLGIEPWLDIEHLLGGQDWEREVRHALRDATHVIAIMSERAVNKRGFVQKELRYALEQLQEFPPGDIFLLPVRLDETSPRHDELLKLHWIDLFPSYYEGFARLAKSLGLALPPLQYISVHTHYTLEDVLGERASVNNVQVVQAHVEDIDSLFTRGIAGAGQVLNVTSNLGQVDIQNEGGVISTVTRLKELLPVRQPVEHVLRWEGINCFTASVETVAQNIAHRLHHSGVHVSFPPERRFKKASGFIDYGDTTDHSPQISVKPDKSAASLCIPYPTVGARLILKWEW